MPTCVPVCLYICRSVCLLSPLFARALLEGLGLEGADLPDQSDSSGWVSGGCSSRVQGQFKLLDIGLGRGRRGKKEGGEGGPELLSFFLSLF